MQSRIRRANRIRPIVRKCLESQTVQQLADISGIPKSVLHDFAVVGTTPQERNLQQIEKWLAREGLMPAEETEPIREKSSPADLSRQLDEIIRLPGDWMEKSFFVAELSAAYRARAMDTAERRAMLRERRRREADTRAPSASPNVSPEDEAGRKAG